MRTRAILGGLTVTLLAGCGGGGGGGTSEATEPIVQGPVSDFGRIQTRGTINGEAVVHDLSQISTVALAGTITEATYRPQGKPDNETAIAVAAGRHIDLFMPDGEKIASWAPASTYFTQIQWNKDGSRLYGLNVSNLCYVSPTTPDTTTLVASSSIGSFIQSFGISPDGSRIALYRDNLYTSDQVLLRSISSSTETSVFSTATGRFFAWAGNDALIVDGPNGLGQYSTSGALQAAFPGTPFVVGGSPDGRYFMTSDASNSNHDVSLFELDLNGFTYKDYLPPSSGTTYAASLSPSGDRWAVAETSQVYTTELLPNYRQILTDGGPVEYRGIAWQPALPTTKFVGSSSKLGTFSAGIIATNRSGSGRNGLSSFVSWDAETRSTSKVSDDPTDSGAGSQSYVIEADRLTALKYANRPLFTVESTVSSSGTANGAIVTVDTYSGLVTSIVVYGETRGGRPSIRPSGDGRTIEGHLLGIWDANGANLAPSGASRVSLDAKGNPTL